MLLEEIVEIKWLTGCQGLIGECSDFVLYWVVDRKPVEVTNRLLAERWRREGRTTRVREFWADCSLCMLDNPVHVINRNCVNNECQKMSGFNRVIIQSINNYQPLHRSLLQ